MLTSNQKDRGRKRKRPPVQAGQPLLTEEQRQRAGRVGVLQEESAHTGAQKDACRAAPCLARFNACSIVHAGCGLNWGNRGPSSESAACGPEGQAGDEGREHEEGHLQLSPFSGEHSRLPWLVAQPTGRLRRHDPPGALRLQEGPTSCWLHGPWHSRRPLTVKPWPACHQSETLPPQSQACPCLAQEHRQAFDHSQPLCLFYTVRRRWAIISHSKLISGKPSRL